jgi:hypothetical protein
MSFGAFFFTGTGAIAVVLTVLVVVLVFVVLGFVAAAVVVAVAAFFFITAFLSAPPVPRLPRPLRSREDVAPCDDAAATTAAVRRARETRARRRDATDCREDAIFDLSI